MTPQQIEAMKMALEALELINIEFVCGNGSHHKKEDRHEWDEDCPITNRWRKAITALEEALAQPEQEPVIDKSAAKRIATSLGWTPQRTWVGLTGLDQKELMAMTARDAVFATEAKLKEKNT